MVGVNPLTIPRTLTCLPITCFPNCAELADKAEALQVTLNSLFSDNLKEEDARQA
ncbi:24603_t:CDS:2 [Entrophospora sp. SA101]|nr:2949_t:CDS:2 [Entrophospora sp. SA101]CAJ0759504.1 24603_t:CDS:2 [Entrophospora sp. SA101]CAJ0834306.1 10807_t:CDS:2 [Entrophospora sp. SA101]